MQELEKMLYNIGKSYLTYAINAYYKIVLGEEDTKVKKKVISSLDDFLKNENELFMRNEKCSVIIKRYITAPNNMNLISSFLYYTILRQFYEKDVKKKCKKKHMIGDIKAHIIRIVQEYENCSSAELNAIINILNCYLEGLYAIATNAYFTIRNDSPLRFYLAGFNIGQNQEHSLERILTKELQRISKKIQYELDSEYIVNYNKYNKQRSVYMKAAKEYFMNQYVYTLGEYKFGDFYIPPVIIKSYSQDEQIERFVFKRSLDRENLWQDIFLNQNTIYITGGPGFGKSLFLKYLTTNSTKINIVDNSNYLWIYGDLKTFYSRGKNDKKSIIDFMQESMIHITGLDEQDISKDFIMHYLKLGRCVLLFDALDEVPKNVRQELHKSIFAFVTAYNPNNKLCITSRDRGFLPHKEIEVFKICALTNSDIETYLDKMIALKKFKKDDKKNFMDQAQILINKKFLNNFLTLSLLVNIYKSENKLPENKIHLYKKCFEYIARERELIDKLAMGYDEKRIAIFMKDSTFINLSVLGAPNNNNINREDIVDLLLKQYSKKYRDVADSEAAISEFLEFCASRTDVFVVASTDDQYKFYHRSFFEYFYARYIYQKADVQEMYQLMREFDVDSEVFELTVALVKEDNEPKYEQLIECLLGNAEEELKKQKGYTAFNILTLSMQVVDDEVFIQQYFDLVMKYNRCFVTCDDDKINNLLVKESVKRALMLCEDNKTVFANYYEKESIVSIFDFLADMPYVKVDETLVKKLDADEEQNIESCISLDWLLYSAKHDSLKFYITTYIEWFDLYEKLVVCCDLSAKEFCTRYKTTSALSRALKGLKRFRRLDEKMRKEVCKYLCLEDVSYPLM